MAFTTIQMRRDTAANWSAANPVLHQGEIGINTDTYQIKIGDGVTAWNSLGYFTGSGTVSTTGSPASGNLTKFSGASTITNGDLSGDITTSGTLVTTVAKIAGTTVSGTTGTTNAVFSNSPTLVTPALGTPSALVLTNATGTPSSIGLANGTGLSLTTGVTGILPVANGGTGVNTLTIHGVLIGNTTGAVNVTSAGTAGQVLTSNGASADPTFQAAGGGSSELVLLATATASASSTLDFTSKITSSYSSYFVVFEALIHSATSSLQMNASIDNGSNFTQTLKSQKAVIQVGGSSAPTYTGVNGNPVLITTSSATPKNSGYAWFACNQTSGFAWQSVIESDNNVDIDQTFIQYANAANPINAIQFLPSSGNFTSGKIYLYGVKNT